MPTIEVEELPVTKNFCRMWLPGPTGADLAQDVFKPVLDEQAAKTVAFMEQRCFSFQPCARQELKINGVDFMTPFGFTRWKGFFGREIMAAEIAVSSQKEMKGFAQALRQRGYRSAVKTRLGTWQPLEVFDRVYDPASGEIMVRRVAATANQMNGGQHAAS